jgi:Toprim-like
MESTGQESHQRQGRFAVNTAKSQDIFAEAREKYTIADLWTAFGFEGRPKGSCKSPFRQDSTPSFSIHPDGTGWTDHGTGEGGDVIEFARQALGGCDHRAVRDWFGERLGIDHYDFFHVAIKPVPVTPTPKAIAWPSHLLKGSTATWEAFAKHRGLTFPAVHAMVHADILRFVKIDGAKCYIITDSSHRAAEIRRIDGKLFGASKAYPLRGVDKSWLPGVELLRQSPKDTAVVITEGATDLMGAIDLYSRFRRNFGGSQLWQPVSLLGASCKNLHPEAASLIRGRRVRIVPDADDAGDVMADHWTGLLRKIGCEVDVVNLPKGTDLTDHLSSISPADLFSK